MADTGALSFTTITNVDYVGKTAWVNPSNALASDNVYSTNSTGVEFETDYLWAVNPNPGIAAGAVIDGILVETEMKCSTSNTWVISAQIIKAGTLTGVPLDTIVGSDLTTDTYRLSGSSAYLFGATLTGSDVNDANFGVAVRITGGVAGLSYSVDHIRITIYYHTESSKTQSDLVSSVTETISKETTSYPYSVANNDQQYILNLVTRAWSFVDNAPYSNIIYRPSEQTMIAARRDTGNICTLDADVDDYTITWTVKTGFYSFSKLDEMKEMPDGASEALKRVRKLYSDVKSTGNITVTIFTEQDSTGKSFTITPDTTDYVVYNRVRTTLSRDVRGKFLAFQFSGTCRAWMGDTILNLAPRALR